MILLLQKSKTTTKEKQTSKSIDLVVVLDVVTDNLEIKLHARDVNNLNHFYHPSVTMLLGLFM